MGLLLEARRLVLARGHNPTLATLPVIALLLDALTMVAAGVLGAVGRKQLSVFAAPADVSSSLVVVGPLVLVGWLLALASAGAYRVNAFGAGTQEYSRVLNASFAMAGIAGVGCYLTRFPLSRGFFVLTFAIGLPVLLVVRYLLRKGLQHARTRGLFLQRVLISGSPGHIDEVAGVLRRERWLGYEIVGALTPATSIDEETDSGIPVLGNTDDVVKFSGDGQIDAVFLADGSLSSSTHMRQIVWDLESEGVQVIVAPNVADVSRERVRIRPVGGLPLVHIDPPSAARAARWGKRTFDLVASLGLLLLLSPVLVLAAVRIKLHDGGPVLFRQVRVGRSGQEFDCFKLRTMVVNAEALLPELHVQSGHDGRLFKLKNDPRVTGPGRWLRRYSIDELPQLINVVRGEMSLVGPRPPLPREVLNYTDAAQRRLRVRPGMTGLWQISGRSDLTWLESVRLDLYYVDNWSMLQDLSILSKTLGAVLRSRGAY